VVGRSLGSYYAAKSAALDRRVKAAVAWGGTYDLADPGALPPTIRDGLLFITGSRSVEEARPYFESVTLDGLAHRITCPLLVVHGGRDRITPAEHAARLVAEAKGPTELLSWPDSTHCAHDRSHIVRPAIADFLLRHL
jgi:2,6-dihydroxypseudooxynicotine hydrolase